MVPVMNSHRCRCHPPMMDCKGATRLGSSCLPGRASPRSEGGRAGRQQAGPWSLPGPVHLEEQAAGRAAKGPLSLPRDPCPPRSPRGILGRERTSTRWKHPEPHRPPWWPRKASRPERTAGHHHPRAGGAGAMQPGAEKPPGGVGERAGSPLPRPSPPQASRTGSWRCGALCTV